MIENALVEQEIGLIIKTDLEKEVLKEINWNYSEIETLVKAYISKYENLVVTEDEVKTAKDVKAKLNNIVKAMNDEKIKINKVLNQVSDKFSKEVNTLKDLITDVSNKIKKQTEAFDELEKTKRKTEIQKIYDNHIGDLKDLFPLEKFWLDSWLLKGTKLKQIEDDIAYKVGQIQRDLAVLSNTPLKYPQECKNEYIRTLNLSLAMEKHSELLENDRKLEELAKKAEVKPNLQPTIEPVKSFVEAVELEKSLIVTVPFEKINELKDYLYLGGYEYREVK